MLSENIHQVIILFASQTGTAESEAEFLQLQLSQNNIKSTYSSLDCYDAQNLIEEVAGPEKCWPGHRKVGTQPGTGKNKGLLGALICETDDGLIQTKVGTGFSDEQRKLYTKDFVIGKIVELEYNMRIESKREDKVDSLFLPRFIELREDKDTTNSSVGV